MRMLDKHLTIDFLIVSQAVNAKGLVTTVRFSHFLKKYFLF